MIKIKNIFFFVQLLLFISYSYAQKEGDIIVKIEGVELEKGKIIVSLLNNKKSYISENVSPYKYQYIHKKNNGDVSCTFENIPFGVYAIQLFYDANNNEKLDFCLGFPKEKYGFSNNARGTFSKPNYKEVCFSLNQNQVIQKINIK